MENKNNKSAIVFYEKFIELLLEIIIYQLLSFIVFDIKFILMNIFVYV